MSLRLTEEVQAVSWGVLNPAKMSFKTLKTTIEQLSDVSYFGRIHNVVGLTVEVKGLNAFLKVGSRCTLDPENLNVTAEVVGFKDNSALLIPFSSTKGLGPGQKVQRTCLTAAIYPDESWLGRVINGEGCPIDKDEPLSFGPLAYAVQASPPRSFDRRRVGSPLNTGVRTLNTFTTVCQGQRLGIFAGSGVGKSILLSMITKFTNADIVVLGLIGERGREVQEFLAEALNEETRKRTVVIVSTSDESAMQRKNAAYTTLAVAEYFRDQGKEVLCLMDSVTRFAMAQREIGLSAGEPAASKGYTPTVFSELPRLLERAGPGTGTQGNITALFTVLVEGDDQNEPISDTVRGVLDGHIVLKRSLAEQDIFPAIDILRSVSRTLPDCLTEEQNQTRTSIKRILAVYEDMEDMIRLGAYTQGNNPAVDQAIRLYPKILDVIKQAKNDKASFEDGFIRLQKLLS